MIVPWITIASYKELATIKRLVQLGFAFLAGFSPYLLLFVSQAVHYGRYSWGDLLSIDGYITHLTRAEYGSFQLYKGEGEDTNNPPYFLKLEFYFSNLVFSEFGVIGAALALVGLIYSISSKYRLWCSAPLVACFAFYITWFFDRCNLPLDDDLFVGVWYRFFPQINMLIAIWASAGLFFAVKTLQKKFALSGIVGKSLLVAVLALSVGRQLNANFSRLDQSSNTYIEEYGRALLSPLPNNSIVLLKGGSHDSVLVCLFLTSSVQI